MDDLSFEALKVRAAVAPGRESWPSGDVQASIMGDRPTLKGDLHWAALHSCVDDARGRTMKALGAMAAVNGDKTLSREGKDAEKAEIANAAIASFEKAMSLNRARESVERQVKKWDAESGLAIKPPASAEEAALLSEIRRHVAALGAKRLAFIDKHATDPRVVAAVLGAPAFLSGLTDADVATVRELVQRRNAPEVADLKAEMLQALAQAEQGCRNAVSQIQRAGGTLG